MKVSEIRDVVENVRDDLIVMMHICQLLSNVSGDGYCINLEIVADTFFDISSRIDKNQKSLDNVISAFYEIKETQELLFKRQGDAYVLN